MFLLVDWRVRLVVGFTDVAVFRGRPTLAGGLRDTLVDLDAFFFATGLGGVSSSSELIVNGASGTETVLVSSLGLLGGEFCLSDTSSVAMELVSFTAGLAFGLLGDSIAISGAEILIGVSSLVVAASFAASSVLPIGLDASIG